jgi:hypothetical protein
VNVATRRDKELFYMLLSPVSSVMYHLVVVVISVWFIEKGCGRKLLRRVSRGCLTKTTNTFSQNIGSLTAVCNQRLHTTNHGLYECAFACGMRPN